MRMRYFLECLRWLDPWCLYTSVILIIILSGNGLSPVRCQAVNFIVVDLIGFSTTVFSEIWCIIQKCSVEEMHFNLLQTSDHIVFINSLGPGIFPWNLKKIIFKLILVNDDYDISSEIALRWTSLDLSDDKSTLVQVMAWCRQATSHYLNQCWPRSLPCGVTRPQWVKDVSSSIHFVLLDYGPLERF